MNQRIFGRRGMPQPRAPHIAPVPSISHPDLPHPNLADELERELRAWKRTRRFRMPWRPLSLMASLCFGIASFVLPASVIAVVQWPLYALSMAALWAGFTRKSAAL